MRNIYKQYGNFRASDNVSFGIEKGKLAALLGPSGSGKTTLLRMIAGLENPNAGDIFIDGKRVNDIPAAKRGIGFVFQSYALFRYMTVFDNIAFGLKIQKKSKKFIKERVNELVKLIGLEGLEKRYPSQLSGGQKQRLSIARALLKNPKILILDDSTSAVDTKTDALIRKAFREEIPNTTKIIIAQRISSVQDADRILVMDGGTICNIGTHEELLKTSEIYREVYTSKNKGGDSFENFCTFF